MTVAKLLADLQARGVRFSVEGERLLYDAPQGVMKPPDLEQLHAHKAELIDYLNKEATQQTILDEAHFGVKDGKPLVPKQTEPKHDNRPTSADPDAESHRNNVESVGGLCGVECATRLDDERTIARDKNIQVRAIRVAERHKEVRIDPTGPCPDCGSGQWLQVPGDPWHCRVCEFDMPLTATHPNLALPQGRTVSCSRSCRPTYQA